jgi:predicted porin
MKETRILLGAVVPAGPGEIHASVVRSDLANSSDDATLTALGYVYKLSKRTGLYGTFAHVSNKGAARFSVSGGTNPGGAGNASPGGPIPGGSSKGFEVGIRHFF